MIPMIIKAGKNYININEISHIQYVDGSLTNIPYKLLPVYEFCMKNAKYITVSEEEFKEFEQMYDSLSKEIQT